MHIWVIASFLLTLIYYAYGFKNSHFNCLDIDLFCSDYNFFIYNIFPSKITGTTSVYSLFILLYVNI